MPFRPESIQGASGTPGEIDYRLARQHLVSEFRKGRLAQHEVCDAHPELIRAARHVGEQANKPCPICEDDEIVFVTYVFGPKMPAHGRCVTTKKEMQGLTKGGHELACYVVEVCRACKWNHLARTFLLTPPQSRARAKKKAVPTV